MVPPRRRFQRVHLLLKGRPLLVVRGRFKFFKMEKFNLYQVYGKNKTKAYACNFSFSDLVALLKTYPADWWQGSYVERWFNDLPQTKRNRSQPMELHYRLPLISFVQHVVLSDIKTEKNK